MRNLAGGSALLSAAAPLGYSLPRQYAAEAAAAQQALDTALQDSSLLGGGLADLGVDRMPKEHWALSGRYDARAVRAQEMLEKARLKQRSSRYLRIAAVPLVLAGGGLVAKGVYDHFDKKAAEERHSAQDTRRMRLLGDLLGGSGVTTALMGNAAELPHMRNVGLGLIGASLVPYGAGLYRTFHPPERAKTASFRDRGTARALSDLGLTKTALGMTLRFQSPEEAQQHMKHRNIIGALGGGLLGGAAGGALGGRLLGVPGAVMGGVAGAALGAIPGKLLADTAHDYRERTTSTYNDTMQRLNAAAGGNIRVASALDEFIQFADQDAQARQQPGDALQNAGGFQLDQEKRERPPGFGPPSALAGSDAGTRMMQIGLPASGAT
jgi:hypothetical protein